MVKYLLVAVGGGLGSLLRYQVNQWMSLLPVYGAAGTLIVNVVGSLLIGYALGLSPGAKTISDTGRLFFVVGFLGGLTTFSSLAFETVSLTLHHETRLIAGAAHLAANLLLGIAAVACGAWLARGVPLS